MKLFRNRLTRILLVIIISIVLLITVVILIFSPVAKSMIEKYDMKYTGRQITLGLIYLNPFTRYLHLSNLKVYELNNDPGKKNNDTVFFSTRGLSVNISLLKLLSKTIEISKITLDQPKGRIIQGKGGFNFSDILKKFSSSGKPKTDSSTSKFSILNIKVLNGEFHYRENQTPINFSIKKVNLESKGKRWDVDTLPGKFSFSSGIGSGDIKGDFTLNTKNEDYRLAVDISKFDLNIIEQYMKDLANYGHLSGNLDAAIISKGNLKDPEMVTNTGKIIVNDFHFGAKPEEDYASFDKLVVAINKMSPKSHIYIYDSISLSHPFIIYERYQYLDNLQRMFGKKGANVKEAKANSEKFNLILEIADYIKVIARNFFKSEFQIKKIAIYNGRIKYNDYSLTEKFSVETSHTNFIVDSINKDRKRVNLFFKTRLKPYGNVAVNLSINPKDSSDFDLNYHFHDFPVAMFNPYFVSYTSYPMDRGTIEVNGNWKVLNGRINSKNHLIVVDPHVSIRVRNKDTKWIPSNLIMALVREQANVIDYEIPISGNLKDPKFHFADVFKDILSNIFTKPVKISYISHVKSVEKKIEKSLALQWDMRKSSLMDHQQKFVGNMVSFLEKNQEASIDIYPEVYADKEKEYIEFFEAKKKYFLLTKTKEPALNQEDSLKVEMLSVNDSSFVRYINKQVKDTMMFTMQQKCRSFIGPELVNNKLKQLNSAREEEFLKPFRKKEVNSRVRFNKVENNIPYNGFSFYRIVYKGEFPKDLIKAYQEMSDLNRAAPRRRFEKLRSKIHSLFGN